MNLIQHFVDGKITPGKSERRGKLLDYEHKGPYQITKVYTNGTVKIQRDYFEEIINIRRIKPFKA